MRDIILVGAGGTSRDIIDLISAINAVSASYTICGIIDDNTTLHGQTANGIPVLGPITPQPNYDGQYVLGVAAARHCHMRPGIAARLNVNLQRFETLIHPTAWVSPHAQVGCGTVIDYQCYVGSNACVGNNVVLCPGSTVAHDAFVGDFSVISYKAFLAGDVDVGASCYIGAAASIREQIIVGDRAVVGIGAVVVKDVEGGQTVAGNPAVLLESKIAQSRQHA